MMYIGHTISGFKKLWGSRFQGLRGCRVEGLRCQVLRGLKVSGSIQGFNFSGLSSLLLRV